MGVRSFLFRPCGGFVGLRALHTPAIVLTAALTLAAVPAPVLASPDCSNAGLKPSRECATKLKYCKHTSIVVVLAVRGRESGMTESDNVAKLSANDTDEIWYKTYRHVVKDIVHQIYTKQTAYRKLRARIAPSMALAVSVLAAGCNADPSVTVEPR